MPKKTLKTIIESGNHYLVQVKKNQPKLYDAIEEIEKAEKAIDTYKTEEKARGRKEKRVVHVYNAKDTISGDWTSLKVILCVERTSTRKGKEECNKSYYMSSIDNLTAKEYGEGIRGHWSIENQLHWVKDVMLKEDDAGINKENGIDVLSIFRSIAINLSRELGFYSIKNAQAFFAFNISFLIKKLRT